MKLVFLLSMSYGFCYLTVAFMLCNIDFQVFLSYFSYFAHFFYYDRGDIISSALKKPQISCDLNEQILFKLFADAKNRTLLLCLFYTRFLTVFADKRHYHVGSR